MASTPLSKEISSVGSSDSPADRIVVAARRHFFAHGFRGVTMDDLAEELGMSKKTLYACFASKSALLEAVLKTKFMEVESDLAAITARTGSDHHRALRDLLTCVQRHTDEIQPAFVRDIRREAPEMFNLIQSRRREVIQRYFKQVLQNGQRAGIIRKDIRIELAIEILLAATDAIINPTRIEELGLTPKTGFTAIITVVMEGVLSEKGRAER